MKPERTVLPWLLIALALVAAVVGFMDLFLVWGNGGGFALAWYVRQESSIDTPSQRMRQFPWRAV